MKDPMQDVKDRLVLAALPDVAFDGWSPKLLADAARRLGLDATLGERAFPAGPLAAVQHFVDLADRRLTADADRGEVPANSITARITWLVRRRIEPWAEHREAISRAVSLLSLHPGKASLAAWRTADLIWYLAGDETADFSYYTKRASLAAVYSATLLSWLADGSDGCAASWEFLDRRSKNLAAVPKMIHTVKRRAQLFGKPMESLLAAARRQGAAARHFGIRD
jgi:ubiquinone biosynthesis protein COQ9